MHEGFKLGQGLAIQSECGHGIFLEVWSAFPDYAPTRKECAEP
jgi:hypothetical protein